MLAINRDAHTKGLDAFLPCFVDSAVADEFAINAKSFAIVKEMRPHATCRAPHRAQARLQHARGRAFAGRLVICHKPVSDDRWATAFGWSGAVPLGAPSLAVCTIWHGRFGQPCCNRESWASRSQGVPNGFNAPTYASGSGLNIDLIAATSASITALTPAATLSTGTSRNSPLRRKIPVQARHSSAPSPLLSGAAEFPASRHR